MIRANGMTARHFPRGGRLGVIAAVLIASRIAIAAGEGVFDVRNFGATGDGKTLDTAAINKAVTACGEAGGGQVRVPPGRYLSATIHLKSHVTLYLEPGARLVGAPDPNLYQHPTLPSFLPEARWGKWHRALILADGQEDITLAGAGVIDGNKVFDRTGEERMRGPHTFVFIDCRNVTVRDVSFVDSANYAIFFQISSDVDIRNVKFTGGWDGVHFRGAPQHPCRNVTITDCRFYTGDDSIAGRYWENVVISGCIVNSSCNGIRLIGPATHLIIRDCLFYGPGVEPHRTSNRRNMLAGINLQPGAWDKTVGDLNDVLISDITMKRVTTPFHFMMKPGNTAGRITVSRVTATGVYRAACSVESWAETPFRNVTFRDVDIEFDGGGAGGKVPAQVKAPGVDARPLPAWGFYARNVENLTFEDVRLTCTKPDSRPVMICEDVNDLALDTFRFSRMAGVPSPAVLTDVRHVRLENTDLSGVKP
jgi:polygalacturonase